MPLPTSLERSYGLFGKRLIGHVHEVGLAATYYHMTCLRPHYRDAGPEDLDENIEGQVLLGAMAALGISFSTLIDEDRLRAVLRRVAQSNDIFVKRQIASALGRPVTADVGPEIDEWIEAQATRIAGLVERWFASVSAEAEVEPEDFDAQAMILALAAKKTLAERAAFAVAAGGLLALNSALVAVNALQSGVQSYVWRTELDERVREHHLDLEGTIQRFDAPPAGGGTNDGDLGNPGDGLNCRCQMELIIA